MEKWHHFIGDVCLGLQYTSRENHIASFMYKVAPIDVAYECYDDAKGLASFVKGREWCRLQKDRSLN